MKKFLFVLIVFVFVFAPLAVFSGEEAGQKVASVTVEGEVLDLGCYLGRGAKGAEHAGCAKRCVKSGQPMGLLAKDGTVYLLLANHKDNAPFEAAKDHAGETVTIKGKAANQEGMKGIEVHSVKAG
jgi:hypothetical protein